MKLVVYGGDKRVGVVRDGDVIDASRAAAKYLYERKGEQNAAALGAALVPPDLEGFIEGGTRALDHARDAVDYLLGAAGDRNGIAGEPLIRKLSDVRLRAPRAARARVAFAGGNFAAQSAAMARNRGRADADSTANPRDRGMWGSWKIDRDAVDPEGTVVYPSRVTQFDYEGECAIILGRQGKNIRVTEARDYIWGVTLFIDWSARDFPEKPAPLKFNRNKNFDNCHSMGPCIVVGELDHGNIDIETFVNGGRRQSFNTREMTFSFEEYIEYLSQDLTLYPGDAIASGTGPGTAMDSSKKLADGSISAELFLKPGDRVEVKNPVLGTLSATVAPPDGPGR